MAGKKTLEKKSAKVKLKKTKKNEALVPRLRLEPRLTPSPSKSIKSPQNLGHGFDEKEFATNVFEKESFHEKNSNQEYKINEDFHDENLTKEESRNNDVDNTECSNSENNEIKVQENKNCKKRKVTKKNQQFQGFEWSDREWMDLAIAFQTHGFSDVKKIADCVKTRNENEIRHFLKVRRTCAPHDPKVNKNKYDVRNNDWNTLRKEYLEAWPNIRKWRRFAYEQMLLYTRSKDYSKPVLSALFKKFYEETEEPSDPQAVNVKLIYKYLMNCMSGNIPPQLPPKESALVLDLLREVRLMPIAYDFEEERKFLEDFRSATRFKPFQVKDEFRKRYKKVPDEDLPSNAVAVPEEIFLDLSRHKRLTQSFSPMITPVWMLQKEQELLEKYATESSVYFH